MPKRQSDFEVETARTAAHYLNLKAEEKGTTASIEKYRKTLLDALHSGRLSTVSEDGHIYATLTLQDNKTQVLVKEQNADRVGMVDDIVDQLRQKLGEEAETYIVKKETVDIKSLESLVASGKVDAATLQDWLVRKPVKSLIVKTVTE